MNENIGKTKIGENKESEGKTSIYSDSTLMKF